MFKKVKLWYIFIKQRNLSDKTIEGVTVYEVHNYRQKI